MFKAYWGLDKVPGGFPPCVLTIGNFDGIHLGHQKILNKTLELARGSGRPAVSLIFDPHPTRVVAPERSPELLTLPAHRLRRFAEHGMDAAIVLEFTSHIAALSPRQFVGQVLVDKLHVQSVVVGENFRFGHRQAGDFPVLAELGKQYGFQAEAVPAVLVGGRPVSSTRIRGLVREGRVEQARRLLGRLFSLQGPIVPGHGVGSRQTVPTLNLAPESQLLPARGVYITETRDSESNRCWPSVTNVGYRPTFDGTEQCVETHLLAEFGGGTPKRIELAFHRRLREEKRFASAELLKKQILRDAERARRFFRLLEAVGSRNARVT